MQYLINKVKSVSLAVILYQKL